jgi:adenylate cyclase
MAKEIERKFLVSGAGWRQQVVRSEQLRDGLVSATEGRKVRVRFQDDRATLTIKGARRGLIRDEYEYPIPAEDAEELLARHCGDELVEKVRHHVPVADLTWVIDVYSGHMAGIVIAEVELPRIDHPLVIPDWAGPEVTGNEAYRKVNMVAARRRARQALRAG